MKDDDVKEEMTALKWDFGFSVIVTLFLYAPTTRWLAIWLLVFLFIRSTTTKK